MEQEQQQAVESDVTVLDTERLDPIEGQPPVEEPAVEVEEAVADPVAPAAPEIENHDLRRMKKYMSRAYEAEAQLEAMRNAQLRQASPAPAAPEREQFADDAAYYAAMTQNEVAKVRAEFDYKFAQIQQQEVTKKYTAQAEEVRKEIPDYDDVIQESTVRFPSGTQDVILSSPHAARLAYEIVKDDDYAEKLAAMPPHIAAREIGKLEAKIEAEKTRKAEPQSKPVSKAPAPIRPLAPKEAALAKDPSKMSDIEWIEHRRRQKYNLS